MWSSIGSLISVELSKLWFLQLSQYSDQITGWTLQEFRFDSQRRQDRFSSLHSLESDMYRGKIPWGLSSQGVKLTIKIHQLRMV
jgi:hypothetical protein